MSEHITLSPRRVGHRPPAKTMIIIVEGRTEKMYFERFRTRDRSIAIRIHESKNSTAIGMIEFCIGLIGRSGLDKDVDEVFAVFDTDRNTAKDIEAAVRLASKHGINICVSNPSFEFWLLLHFEDNRVADTQDVIEELIGKHTERKYKKPEGINKHINDNNIENAIVRSRHLLPSGDPADCKNTSPSTCVHILVEKLKPIQ